MIPAADIIVENEATNVRQTTKTNASGRYFFASLPPGTYKLSAASPGFKTLIRSGLVLQVQQQANVDLVMTPGELTTSVTVSGEAPRLDSVSATLGRVVDNAAVLSMPLSSRNTLDLAMLAPGVSGTTGFTGTNFASNGTRNSQSDVLIDGTTVSVQEQNGGVTDTKFRPSVEAVQEMKVMTNSFSAEFGNTGGTVVTMVTRSGTNELHGSAFEFLRNSALNANTFFANRSGRSLVPFRRNQFGGAIGGPVVLPRIYNGKDRTFFFFHYEGTRQSSQSTTLTTVPTAREKLGDFSDTRDGAGRLITIYDPETVHAGTQPGTLVRDPFPNNTIPRNRFDPVAAYSMQFYPEANLPGNAFTRLNNFFNAGSRASNEYQTTIKIDHNITSAQRVAARYSQYRITGISPNLWGNWMNPFDDGPNSPGDVTRNGSADYTYTVSPTTVMNLRWGVARQYGVRVPFCEQCPEFDINAFGFQGPMSTMIPPNFQPESYQSLGTRPQARVRRGEDVNHFVGNLSKVAGRHTIKFGGDARIYRLNYAQPGWSSVSFNFSRLTTSRDPFRGDSLQGNGLASMLLGWGSSGQQSTGAYSSWASSSYGIFVQDDWHPTNKLTFNLGLRYELDSPRTERYNRVSWVDPLVISPVRAPGLPELRGGLVFATADNRSPLDTDLNNFAPRFGFAYNFHPKYVVRGGYGIYYGISAAQNRSQLGQGFNTSTPWNTSLDGGVTRYASLSRPFPDGIDVPPGNSQGLNTFVGRSISGPIRSWGTKPYYEQWSFSIQHELPANSVLEIAYFGNKGVHLYFGNNTALNRIDPKYLSLGASLNDVVPNPFFGVITDPLSALSKPTVTRIQLLRPYPQFTGVSGVTGPPTANSIYHALQLQFTKRYSHGLSMSAHYTLSKMLDDDSLTGGLGWLGYDAGGIQSYGNLKLERAVSVYDRTHRAVVDFAYELPFGRGKKFGGGMPAWVDWIGGGWQANGILSLQSGAPLVPALTGGVLPDARQRPNLLRDPGRPGSITENLNGYLDPAAFSRPEPYTLGTAPRTISSLRAPGSRNLDASLFKNLYFTESRRLYLQLRGEAFNITNTPIFAAPDMNFGSSSFGVISGQANSPRQLQVAMKLYF
ncbi:MAG: hypothetical protein QOJ99_4804 [Bryobacterales bacterium]|nr:hypothetical protein [Bryobacterales bacterium]